jgi:hypothetical protein
MSESFQHKFWAKAKDAASALYRKSLSKGEFLDLAGGQATDSYPLQFKAGLGKQLDLVVAIRDKAIKAGEKSSDAYEKMQQALIKQTKATLQTLQSYRQEVTRHQAKLDEVNPKVAELLLKALAKVTADVKSIGNPRVYASTADADAFQGTHKAWQEAKKASESAFKTLLKDKDAAAALKKVKITGYPFGFKGGAGKVLEKIAVSAREHDQDTSRKLIKELGQIVQDYQSEVTKVQKLFAQAEVSGKSAEAVFSPLTKQLRNMADSAGL